MAKRPGANPQLELRYYQQKLNPKRAGEGTFCNAPWNLLVPGEDKAQCLRRQEQVPGSQVNTGRPYGNSCASHREGRR